MTRKHFVELAAELRAARSCWADHPLEDYPEYPDPEHPDGSICPEQEQWHKCVQAVATACYASNPRFSRERFVAACNR